MIEREKRSGKERRGAEGSGGERSGGEKSGAEQRGGEGRGAGAERDKKLFQKRSIISRFQNNIVTRQLGRAAQGDEFKIRCSEARGLESQSFRIPTKSNNLSVLIEN